MKLSVIFGVLHMTMGILHKGTNCVYFRDWASLFTEVITGLIILLGLFGWMDLLIIAKWLTPLDIDNNDPSTDRVRCPGTSAGLDANEPYLKVPSVGDCENQNMPSVINLMIDTVFAMG